MGKKDHLGNLGVDGVIVLKRIFMIYDGGEGHIDLVQYMNTWHVITNATMNLRVSQNVKHLLPSSSRINCSRKTLLHGLRYLVNLRAPSRQGFRLTATENRFSCNLQAHPPKSIALPST